MGFAVLLALFTASATAQPFRAAGLYCPPHTQVRASVDGVQWTEWIPVPEDEGAGSLVYFGALHHYLETTAACRVLRIDPGETPPAQLKRIRERAAVDPLPVVKRDEWGCTQAVCPVTSAPSYTTVTHLIVHHSASANTSNDWPAVLRSFWVLHVRGNGWADIGYNYLVDPDGVLYEGRAGGDGVLGAHFSGVNTGTMGVCMVGTFTTEAPTQASVDTLRRMLAWQAGKWKLDPGGVNLHNASGLMLNVVSGHRDAGLSPRATSTTECPGNGLYALLPDLRRKLRQTLEEDCPLTVENAWRCASGDGGIIELPYSTSTGCNIELESQAPWIRAEREDGILRVHIASNEAASSRTASIRVNRQSLSLTQAGAGQPAPPCIGFRGVVSAASFDERPAVAGSLVAILGEHFAPAEARSDEWPTTLGDVSVKINNRPAALAYVSPRQIDAQVPDGTSTGSARISITSSGVTGPERLFWVSEAAPSIFYADSPVHAGDTISVYLTGAGRSGLPWSVNIGRAVSLTAAESLPGVQVARIELPADLPPGEHDLFLTIAGVTSSAVRLRVAP
ncbi:MAG: N-acetylmuramoyl-L-alanine amidase [Acidobacteria bacterium]|nr:N-acetylmuramoyl-L-alanine amidase [Acidobacteriota bacterium]